MNIKTVISKAIFEMYCVERDVFFYYDTNSSKAFSKGSIYNTPGLI